MENNAKSLLETVGIDILGQERPEILVQICKDNFLPPSQLILALQALEWYPDKEGIRPHLEELLDHYSDSVATQAAITLGMDYLNDPRSS